MKHQLAVIAPTLGATFSGKERVTQDLVTNCPNNSPVTPVLFSPSPSGPRHGRGYVLQEYVLTRRARKTGLSSFFFPYGTAPNGLLPRGMNVGVMVLDLFFGRRVQAQTMRSVAGSAYRAVSVPAAVRRADWIATMSDEVTEWCMNRRSGVRHIGVAPGVDLEVFARIAPRGDEGRPYVLVLGGTTERKNVSRQLSAAQRVAERNDLSVVVVGRARTPPELGNRAIHFERVSDSKLAALYAGASVVCVAPLGEGWGLPALEALAMGSRVAAAITPSLLDLQRRIGSLDRFLQPVTDPRNEDEILFALEQALSSDFTLVPADALDAKRRAAQFWAEVSEIL